MRAIVALLCVVLATNAEDVHQGYYDEVNEVHDLCLTESQCDKDILKKHYIERNVDDPKLRKYLMCVSKKLGYRNDAGEYQPEVHKKALIKILKVEKKVNEIMKKCVIISKDTPEESELLSGRCFEEDMRNFFIRIHDEKLEKFLKECKTETNVTDAAMKALHAGKKSNDPKIKDFAVCMMKHFGLMSETGEFNIDVIKSRLYFILHDRNSVNEFTDKCCKNLESPQETAYRYVLCKFQNVED